MKKRIIVDTIIVMALSYLLHGIYEMWPNALTSVLFPVNESIFEHGKLILVSFLLLYPIDLLLFKENETSFSINVITSIICIVLTYLVFTPIFLYILKTNDNMAVTISIYTICVIVSLIIREKVLNKYLENDCIVGIILTVAALIIFGILTYNPIKQPIFYDYNNEAYGIVIHP